MKSAHDWLIENYIPRDQWHSWKTVETLNDPCPTMERFANYRTKELQAKILSFRISLKVASEYESQEGEEAQFWLEMFDKMFEITEARNGQI